MGGSNSMGFSEKNNERISQAIANDYEVFDSVSIRHDYGIRILNESKFRVIMDKKPLILVINKIEGIKNIIESKGIKVEDLLRDLLNK